MRPRGREGERKIGNLIFIYRDSKICVYTLFFSLLSSQQYRGEHREQTKSVV